MNKYILKGTNEELSLGAKIYYTDHENTRIWTLNEESISFLEKLGIIEVKIPQVSRCLSYYIKRLADKEGWQVEKMDSYLNKLYSISKVAALSIILKEIAIELDKKYESHIYQSEEIYVISMANGQIVPMPKNKIKNYRNFAAFRTVEDAQIAMDIVSGFLKAMF